MTRELSRRDGVVVGVVALVICLLQRPGLVSPDTKLDLTADPIGFLMRAAHLWSPDAPMGQVQNQAYGYFFPHGLFFAAGDLLHVPAWIVQRCWWALLLTAGFIGVVRLAEALRTGSFWSRLAAAWVFVLAPRVMTTLGTISSETLPMMLAPWVLIPLVRALDDVGDRRPLWREAARSACAIALMGAVNAVATAAAVAISVIWWVLATARRDRSRRRRGLVFGAWWAAGAAAACLWWLAGLAILSRVSPPFLDFIESASVTTEWTSLTEVLRGTDSWTPFVSPERAVGAVLVSEPAAVLATGVLAAAGLAGLTMRAMPYRGRLLTIAAVGLLAMCLGYPGTLGSPIRETVVAFLDGSGAALRNIHKFDPLVRLPLALGIAHLLARVRVPARTHHAERGVAAALVVVIAAFGSGSLLWTGGLAPAKSYRAIPDYWAQTADWLAAAEQGSATPARALVVPGAPFADQLWGLTRDEPLQALAQTPWAVRDAIPLTPPGAIRAMDSVQRALSSGRGSPGLAETLVEQGVSYVVLRADLDPDTSRSARPLAVAQALALSPGFVEAARFGPPVAPAALDGIVVDDGLRPPLPAITVYRVDPDCSSCLPGGPRLVDAAAMTRVDGGPEALLALADSRRRSGAEPLGPALLTTDAARAGLPAQPFVVTDTPVDRETDFGRVDEHSSAVRAPGDPRLTKNAAPDYPVPGRPLVEAQWVLDNRPGQVRVTSSGSAADATQPGRTSPANSTAAAFDGDPATAWVSRGLESAVGRWLAVEFTTPRSGLAVTVTTAKALGPDVSTVLVSTDTGSTVAQGIEPGVPTRIVLPGGPTSRIEVRAIDTANGTGGNQFAVAELSLSDANSGAPLSIRQRTVLPTRDAADRVSEWVLGPEFGARPDCLTQETGDDRGRVRCSPALGSVAETPGVFGRVLSVPAPTEVAPSVVLRPKPGGELAALLRAPATLTADGAAAVTDPRGNASAAVDADPNTAWIAAEPAADSKPRGRGSSTAREKDRPRLTLHLPTAQEVSGLRLQTPHDYPARPTELTVEFRDGDRSVGRERVEVPADGAVTLSPHRADSLVLTVEKQSDLINVNDLGFASDAPVGIGEIEVLTTDGAVVGGRADDTRPIEIRCDADPLGPHALGLTVSGQVVRLQARTTAGALRRGEPVIASPCPGPPVQLAAGEQELSVNPGGAFTVDAVTLTVPGARAEAPAVTRPRVESWGATERLMSVDAASTDRVLSVPESTNPGWHARIGDRELTPVTVNGWQQGWVVPAGAAGTIALTFDLDSPYRWALAVGLSLVALLFAVAWWPLRRTTSPRSAAASTPAPTAPQATLDPTAPQQAGRVGRGASRGRIETPALTASQATPDPQQAGRVGRGASRGRIETPALTAISLTAAFLLAGWPGTLLAAATGVVVWRCSPRIRPGLTFGAMLAATVVLAAGPWHSGAPYLGYSGWAQAFALVAVAAAVASTLVPDRPRISPPESPEQGDDRDH
ncbi:alpha-(1-_3)-arabinofuranosyltransferase domain-containing protein [Gordonia aichiensis]|uniref:alpha-(1->3)-arabinofuranosyltransferase domain-containing protein n=1 Tax=Gordonia aichiensis TaxID=36820 RepID=UPI003D76939E